MLNLNYSQLLVLIVELDKCPAVTEATVVRLQQIIDGNS